MNIFKRRASKTGALLFSRRDILRYHYQKPDIYTPIYGETYICKHPVYDRCTLFKIHDKGLAVIQQRYDEQNKSTYWTEIDP